MQPTLMITNGGPHSAAYWAETTAAFIVSIADTVHGERRAGAIKLQAAVIDILTEYHEIVQNGERAAIGEEGSPRLIADLNCDGHISVEEVVAAIVAAAEGTEWFAALATEESATMLVSMLTSHFNTNMFIERSWHADRNPTAPEVTEFRATHNLGA